MPESRPPPRLNLRFAAIGTLSGLMVLVPLGQVLRYQTDEIQLLVAERAFLDPVAHAVDLQRSLIGHGDVAGRVLAGRRQLEGERRLRQAEVDGAVHELKSTLSAGLWHRALAESDSLSEDWHDLAGRIQLGKVDEAGSRAGHRLLVEQALQVMDLVSARAGANGAVALLQPVTAWQLQPGSTPAEASAHQRAALDHAHAALAARSVQLHGQLGRLQSARHQQIAGLVALLLAVVVASAGFLRQHRRPVAPRDGGGDPGQRRGHGRRSTDKPQRIDAAHGLIGQLRQGQADAASPSQTTLPPRP